MTRPLLFAVSTLGRQAPLRRLIDSVVPQLGPGDRLAIVAQDNADDVRRMADAAGAPDRIVVRTSARGASLGRNTGIDAFAGADDNALVMFPNDTTWFPPGSVDAIRRLVADAPGGAVTVSTEIGPRFVLTPIRLFEGSFGGPTLYQNAEFVTPAATRASLKKAMGDKYRSRKGTEVGREERSKKRRVDVGEDELARDKVFA